MHIIVIVALVVAGLLFIAYWAFAAVTDQPGAGYCAMIALAGSAWLFSAPIALTEDCARATVLVSAAQASGCKGPAVMIDQKAAADSQGWRITLSPMPAAQSVRQYRGDRPWVVNTAL
jgi:hypothetical protein